MLSSLHIQTQEEVISDHQSVLTTSTCETVMRSNVTPVRIGEVRAMAQAYVRIVGIKADFKVSTLHILFFEQFERRTLVTDDQIREIILEALADAETANANVDRDVAQELEVDSRASSSVSSLGNSAASSIAGGGPRVEAAAILVGIGNENPNDAEADISEEDTREN